MTAKGLSVAYETFEAVKSAFPNLSSELYSDHWYLDLCLDFPEQKGLEFAIFFNLQNDDELHLNVDEFWGSWFPCTESKVAEEFSQAAIGMISGRYRLKILSNKRFPYKRLLQKPEPGGWKTIYNHTSLHWPCFRPSTRYLQNCPAT